ncbi:MAG TPA: EAL domain-containing protein [Gemmatimonadaceae bacterium]|nr:EAL domain-containing protein [Gemmatimonadaceae bacterium]
MLDSATAAGTGAAAHAARRRISRAFLVAGLAIVGIAGTFLTLSLVRQRSRAWTMEARQVARLGRDILALAVDQETGVRGYRLTGDRRWLEPHDAARRALPAKLDSLVTLTTGRQRQDERARAIVAALAAWDSVYRRPALATPAPNAPPDEARRRFELEGKRRFDEVRHRIAALLATEDARYGARLRAEQRLDLLLTIGVLLELALLLAAGRHVARRLRTQADQLYDQQDQLEHQAAELEQQTAEVEMVNDELQRALREREAALEESTHAVEALRQSERRYRALVESSPDAIAIHAGGTLRFVNPAAATLMGMREPRRISGRPLLSFVHPEDQPRVAARLAELQRNPQTLARSAPETYRLLRGDGQVVHVEARSAPVMHEGERATQTVLRDIGERLRLEAELTRRAYHDGLTGLVNRARFRECVAEVLARRTERGAVAVLLLDLDDFKAVNDGLGHAAGDLLLVAAAQRLRELVAPHGVVARLGGDEFAVLLEQVAGRAAVQEIADRVLGVFREPLRFEEREMVVHASVGIVLGADGDSVDSLLRNADLAMYVAKHRGKSRAAWFEPGMYQAARERLAIEADMRLALQRDEFRLVFQPVVHLATGAIQSVEALVRWHHPVRGVVSPATFIPVAEATGLIVPLGRWVLRQACAQLAEWQRAAGTGAPPISMGINLSGRQLQDPRLLEDVAAALDESGVPPESVVLEITESVIMRDTETTLTILRALRALGLRLAIDDFGTGYSSLAYLQRFPIDVLKIDKAFVDGVASRGSDAALARLIVSLGEALGLSTIAEGVETAEQQAALVALGCTRAQGYHFFRPVEASAVSLLLRAA